MRELLANLSSYFVDVFGRVTVNDALDVLIVAFIIYQLMKLLRKTRASQVVRGLAVIIAAVWIAADIFQLQMLRWLLDYVMGAGALVLVVLFQPELRRAFEQIGRRTSVDHQSGAIHAGGRQSVAEELSSAALTLSRRKVGALIVFERRSSLQDVIQTGTMIDSLITAPLLENIFEPNTPLHDGAVVIHGMRVIAAGCVLPLTEEDVLYRELGTRHRAGLGVTEGTDAVSLIVSEETGTISFARGGRLTRHLDADALREFFQELYDPQEESGLWAHFSQIFAKWRKRP